jgi:hypothetical protein
MAFPVMIRTICILFTLAYLIRNFRKPPDIDYANRYFKRDALLLDFTTCRSFLGRCHNILRGQGDVVHGGSAEYR